MNFNLVNSLYTLYNAIKSYFFPTIYEQLKSLDLPNLKELIEKVLEVRNTINRIIMAEKYKIPVELLDKVSYLKDMFPVMPLDGAPIQKLRKLLIDSDIVSHFFRSVTTFRLKSDFKDAPSVYSTYGSPPYNLVDDHTWLKAVWWYDIRPYHPIFIIHNLPNPEIRLAAYKAVKKTIAVTKKSIWSGLIEYNDANLTKFITTPIKGNVSSNPSYRFDNDHPEFGWISPKLPAKLIQRLRSEAQYPHHEMWGWRKPRSTYFKYDDPYGVRDHYVPKGSHMCDSSHHIAIFMDQVATIGTIIC